MTATVDVESLVVSNRNRKSLGDISFAQSKHEDAGASDERALELNRQGGVRSRPGGLHHRLGDIALALEKREDALALGKGAPVKPGRASTATI
jgi:hypothetical protein